MAKRFTDTEIWNDPWFRKLDAYHQNFWRYLCDRCDMAGFWKKDWEDVEFRCHLKADDGIIERFNNGKTRLIDKGDYIHIVDFIFFQYNRLKFESKPHQAVIDLLKKYVTKGLITEQLANTYLSVKDKDKDKDKEKDKDKDIYGQFKNVYLKADEVAKLKEQFGQEFEHKIENLSNYIAMKGDKYKSHYAVILNWAKNDKTKRIIRKI